MKLSNSSNKSAIEKVGDWMIKHSHPLLILFTIILIVLLVLLIVSILSGVGFSCTESNNLYYHLEDAVYIYHGYIL